MLITLPMILLSDKPMPSMDVRSSATSAAEQQADATKSICKPNALISRKVSRSELQSD